MQPNEEQQSTIVRADDRTRHHKKIITIVALGIITILIALAVVAWYEYQATLKNQTLRSEYQTQSFQNSAQEAAIFFKANPPSTDMKSIVASQKSAADFFKANPPQPETSAQMQLQEAELSAMQEQGFQSWKSAQPNQ